MYRQDVVWRADTGHYHAHAAPAPVLLPPMHGAPNASTTTSEARPTAACVARWFSSTQATNVLLLLLLVVLVLRGD